MRLVSELADENLVRLFLQQAANDGWLIQSEAETRCGFGDPLVSLVVDSLDDLPSLDALFSGLDFHDATLLTAFAAVPFSHDEAFALVVPTFQLVIAPGQPARWIHPEHVSLPASTFDARPAVVPRPVSFRLEPSPDAYAAAVATAVESLRAGDIQKVVLARSCQGELSADISSAPIADRLHQLEPSCTIYAVPTMAGARFTGASPELLVSLHGDQVACHPLAGTISTEGLTDTSAYTTWLRGSNKNRVEHQIVVHDIVERLTPYCVTLSADAEPSIVPLRSVAHLGTNIVGKVHEEVTALNLVQLLHPTPAVGGLPRLESVHLIAQLEGRSRGVYAGAVGWVNAAGEGAWWVAIRGILTQGRHFEVWAGAGIVADSDPIAEREETKYKLDSVLHAIGLGTLN